MQPRLESDRSLVQRMGAERYILISLVSFAGSVIVTRTFLSLTGYPQLGNSTLHIAHVLYGGLLLFISGMLPLVVANAWAYNAAAVLNGAGMGLFIDEIGKFITQTNDYFYPPAAPIIYAFFLLTVLLYIYIRKPRRQTPRRVMYQVLHDLGEVIDHDLQPAEKAMIVSQLDEVIQTSPDTNLSLLARELKEFFSQDSLIVNEHLPLSQRRWLEYRQSLRARIEKNRGGKTRFRLVLSALLFVSGGLVLLRLLLMIFTGGFQAGLLAYALRVAQTGQVTSPGQLRWSIIRIVLEGGFSLLLAVSGGLLFAGRERLSLRLAAISLVMLLTTVDLLVFYFDQFAAVTTALAQFALLLLVWVYRRWFLGEVVAGKG